MSRYHQRYQHNVSANSPAAVVAKLFVTAASAATLVFGAWAWQDAQREEATRIKPLSDNAYSPQRLKECDDNNAQRAAQGKPAQLCMPDLVIPVRPDGKTIDFIELNPPAQ